MRKVLFILLLGAVVCGTDAQSVLGIPFGSSYDSVKNKLESRFGSTNVMEDGGKIIVLTPVIGNYEFK